MSVLSPTASASGSASTTSTGRSLVRATVAVGAGAAGAVSALAAGLHAAGVPFAVGGEMIPLAGFAQLTFVGAVIGGVLLAVVRRSHRRFVRITGAMTVLSCVPSVLLPPDVATKASLVLLHPLAAALIVPVLAGRATAA